MCVNRVYTFNNETELIHKHLQKKIETFLTTLERAKLLEYDYLSENNYLSVFDTIKKLRIAWEKNNSFWSIKTPYFAKRLLQFIMIPMVGNRQFYQKYPNVYSEIQKLVIAALKTSLNCNESKNSFLYESDRNERHDLYVFAVKYFEYDKLFLSIMTNVMFDLKYHRIHPAPFANGYQFIKNEKTIQNNVLYNHQQTHIASEDYIRSVFVLSNKLFIASGGRVSSQDIFRQDILEVMSILNPSLLTAATIALLYASGIDKAKKTFLKEKYTNYHAYYDISNSLLHEINANDGLVLNIISDCWEESLPVKDMINCILPSLHAYRNQSNVAIFEIIVSLMNSAYKLQDRIIQKLCNFVKENYSRQCYIKCLYKMYDSFDQHISKFKLNRNDTLIVIEQSNEFENVIAHNDLDVSISSDDYREAFVSEDLTFSFNRDNCESYKSLAYLSKELIIQYTIEDTAFYESEMTNKEMTTQAKRAINEIDFEYIGENDNYAILSQHNPVILYKYNNMPLDSLSKASILIVRSVHIHYKPRGSLVNDRFNIPIKKDLNNDYCGGSINFNPENSLSLIGVPISIEKKEMLNVALDAGFKSMVEYALKQKLDNACILKEMERSFNYDLIIHVLEIAVRMGPIAINRFLIVASKTIRSVGTLIEIQRIAMALINYRSICKYENMFPQIPKNQNNIDEDSENNEMVNTIDSREVLEDLREIPTNNEGICKDLAYCANISQVQSNVEKLPNNNSGDDDYKTSFLKEDWKKNFSLPTKPFPIPGILDGKEQIFDVLFKIPVTTELSNDIHKYCADLKTEIDLNHFNHYLLNSIFNTLAVRLTSKKRTSFLEDQIHWLWNYSAVMVNEVIGDTNSEYIQTKAHLSALYNNAKSLASIKIEALKLLKCAVVKQPFYIKP
uniref:Non-specific serine/threonine protein kinase n=1 Tax=Rhabditophanes sp. KR3021 TaxID=114890 RepID=A0AC35UC47_9BILA